MWARRAQSSANNGDGQQEDVKIVIQKYGGDGIEFTRFCRCTLNYYSVFLMVQITSVCTADAEDSYDCPATATTVETIVKTKLLIMEDP